jgi:hypothetical protein
MSMMCFVRPQCPKKVDSFDEHQIKGLNVEALAEILFPPPTWITDPKYSFLRANSENDDLQPYMILALIVRDQVYQP